MPEFEPVIGLEVHAQLRTATKIFCSCAVRFGDAPNELTCPVCLGLPGALPVLNRQAVALAVRLALAVGCVVRPRSVFARKNYFYPDLPKGYQISQFDLPLAEHGCLVVETKRGRREVRIMRVHMEEDAGKLIHEGPLAVEGASIVDFNRAGVPLIEIVGEPDLRSPEEAYDYLTRLKSLLTYTKVCDGIMEEGSLRCDANVSIREKGVETLGTRVELKNLNSFRNVERALRYEIARQIEVVGAGGTIVQETLLYDADTGKTRPMRSKEEAHDYRYFPDPDLLPLTVTGEFIEQVRRALPELPAARKARFVSQFGLAEADAHVLALEKPLADYFEAAIFDAGVGEASALGAAGTRGPAPRTPPEALDRKAAADLEQSVFGRNALPEAGGTPTGPGSLLGPTAPPKEVAKWVLRELMEKMKDEGIAAEDLESSYPPRLINRIVRLVEAGRVNGTGAAEIFETSWLKASCEVHDHHEAAANRPSGVHRVRLIGLGLVKPVTLTVSPSATLGEILAAGKATAEGFAIHVDGVPVIDPSFVPKAGAIITEAPSAQAVAGLPGAALSITSDPESILSALGLEQISDEGAIARAVEEVVKASPRQLEQYRGGKEALYGYFVGQVMKAMHGRANTTFVNRLLKERLSRPD